MGIFDRLKRAAAKVKRKVVSTARVVKKKVYARAPVVKKITSTFRRVVRKIKPIPRKTYAPKPRIINRAVATRIQPRVTTPKRINKKSISIFDKLKSATGRALSSLKRVQPKPISLIRPGTSLNAIINKIKAKPVRENVKEKKSIFSKLKSISQKVVGTAKNYILPVGTGLATAGSKSSVFMEKFFGTAKKTAVGTATFGLGLGGFGLGLVSKTKSKVGEWLGTFKEKAVAVKEKGLIPTITDFFKGEGYVETERFKEEKQILTLQEKEQKTIIRNIGIGVVALIGGFLLLRKK